MTADTTIATVVSKIATVANRGTVTKSITTSGGSYTIPAGYHNGSGKVTGPTLATLVGTNVNLDNNARLLSGYTAYGKNGTKYTGSHVCKTLAQLVGTNVNLDNNARLLSGYTAYGKNGTKYTGSISSKTSGSTSITTSDKYGFDTNNGFWMYIPANAYYGTDHWLNVPYAQASSLLGGTAASWNCPYMSSSTGVNKNFPSTIFSEKINRACYIIAASFVHDQDSTSAGVTISGGSQRYRWQGKVSLDSSWSCGCGTIVVQYVPAGTTVTVKAASVSVNSNTSSDYIVVKGAI